MQVDDSTEVNQSFFTDLSTRFFIYILFSPGHQLQYHQNKLQDITKVVTREDQTHVSN